MRTHLAAAALAAALILPQTGWSLGASGAYLAARQASLSNDYAAAAEYFTRALSLDPGNPALMENAMSANVSLGHFDRALPIAQRMRADGIDSQIAALVVMTDRIKRGKFREVLDELQSGGSVGPLVDGLAEAWAQLGVGDAEAALASFDALSDRRGLQSFALLHKALALASAGDLEGADAILAGRDGAALNVSRRGVLAHVQILSQLGRDDDAVALIDTAFGATPAPLFGELRSRLAAGETLAYDVVTSPGQGMAEVLFSVAGALAGETAPTLPLIYARMAEHLYPGHVDALLMSAALLEEAGQPELAVRSYDRVPLDHPAHIDAELGRAEALESAGRDEAAVEVLRRLARSDADALSVQTTLGDTLRRMERYEEASAAYDRAVDLVETPSAEHWILWFARGVARERTDRWEEAEADFRFALTLSPEQPQVLNYLGYSLVERREKLQEALDMIERAVAARPDDGYITDSLGWVLYRLGRYDEAIGHMERAVELTPTDPIITDHLGDVLWAVGRQMEARFQWRRAMSFDPEPEEAERIRRKLEVGLDAVLAEEGAEPIDVAGER